MYSERALVRKLESQFASPEAIAGIGDDAAVISAASGFSILFCSDLIVEGTHFAPETHPADSIGFKAIAVNVSDIGAMGGVPQWCLLSMAVPEHTPESWIDGLLDGVAAACDEFGVRLVGGDTAEGEKRFIDVAMLGKVPSGREVRRSGARAGDSIYVTGSLGGSARGLALLGTGDATHPAITRHLYPTPRHRTGQSLREQATAMIDVSDGLSSDLGHILAASHVSARVWANLVPRDEGVGLDLALHGGEDYELIVTGRDLPPQIGGVPLTRIGEIIESGAEHTAWVVTASGEQALRRDGWQHFA